MSNKIFLLDTNVLIYDTSAIYNFGDHTVAIPLVVLEELDGIKSESSERGQAARAVVRELDSLRNRGSLQDGVALEEGGLVKIVFFPRNELPDTNLFLDVADNEIILTALGMLKKGFDIVFITKDLNARVKADALGVPTQDYSKDAVPREHIYRGWRAIDVSANELKKVKLETVHSLVEDHMNEQAHNAEQEEEENSHQRQTVIPPLVPNEFVFLRSPHAEWNSRLFRYLGYKKFKEVTAPTLQWPIKPKNPQQLMTLDLLFDPDVKLISLIGPAGTGKTFLALVSGLQQVINDEYRRVLATRPVVPLGPDIGYLPGDIQEKLRGWMQPMYDSIDILAHASSIGQHMEQVHEQTRSGSKERSKHPFRKGEKRKEQSPRPVENSGFASLDQLINAGKVSLEAITYMRGRSIPFQYILIDEVQNLTPHEVKTLVSRAGEGTKLVLAGDPFQIDSPYLDVSTNGLVVTTNKFIGQPLFGAVFLETSERSELSRLAGELL